MSDLIDRQAAINEMKIRRHSAYEWYVTAKSKDDEEIMIRADSALASFIECILTIKALPSAEQHAQWEYVDYGGIGNWHCSACRAISPKKYNFCPTCGRDMRGDYQ